MNETFSPEDLFSQFATGGFSQEPQATQAQAPTFQTQAQNTPAPSQTSGEGGGQQESAQSQGQGSSEIAELKAMIAKQNETIAGLQAAALGGAPTFQEQHQQGGFGQQPPRPAQPQQPPAVDPEQVKQQWLQQFYEDPLGAVDRLATARAQQMIAQHVEPLRNESTQTFVDNYLARQRVSDGIYESVEPEFRRLINDRNVQATLAKMPAQQREKALEDIYNAATGVAYRSNLKNAVKNGKIDFRPAPSYSAGYAPRAASTPTSNMGYDAATQMAYDRLIASGVSANEAAEMLADGGNA